VVPAARAKAGGGDRSVEPLDRRALLRVRAKVQDLRRRALIEGRDPKVVGVVRSHLRAAGGKGSGELHGRGLGRQGDEQRPAPRPAIGPEDRIKVRRPVDRPVQALQHPDPALDAALLQRESEPICGCV
jgi:hypothetical protein